ncbi:MAG: hypothetical protein ACRC9Y_16555 [Aeromonas veronii]
MINTIVQDSLKQLHESVDIEINKVKKFHYPIYGANERNHPQPCLIGTCIILEIDQRFFLVSASHVFNENEFTTIYIGGGEKLFELTGLRVGTPGDDSDLVDIAIMEVTKDNLDYWSIENHIGIDSIYINKECKEKEIYTFIGYPATKSKVVRTQENHVRPELYQYYSFTCKDETYQEISVSRATHILISFEGKKCFSGGQQVTFPKPNGISGGGVWFNSNLNLSPIEVGAKLAGIAVKNCKSEKCLLAINIDAVLQVIKNEHCISSLSSLNTVFAIT